MLRRLRARPWRTAAWIGAVLTVLSVALWGVSVYRAIYWISGRDMQQTKVTVGCGFGSMEVLIFSKLDQRPRVRQRAELLRQQAELHFHLAAMQRFHELRLALLEHEIGWSESPLASRAWAGDWEGEFQLWPIGIILRVPGWVLVVLSLSVTSGAWRIDRRRSRPGHCGRCGYDRAGIAVELVCPECGFPASV